MHFASGTIFATRRDRVQSMQNEQIQFFFSFVMTERQIDRQRDRQIDKQKLFCQLFNKIKDPLLLATGSDLRVSPKILLPLCSEKTIWGYPDYVTDFRNGKKSINFLLVSRIFRRELKILMILVP